MRAPRTAARPGFTLVELLVVIAIICVLVTVGYMTLPSLAGDYNRTRGIDALSEWLLTSKMRAKRDGLPTGIRLTGWNSANNCCSQVTYVQQPDALTSGNWANCSCTSIAAGTATFANTDFWGPGVSPGDPNSVVQPGDYLEIFGGGAVHQIASVPSATTLTLANTGVSITLPAGPLTNFRILRAPRVLVGEDVKQLFANLGVNVGTPPSVNIPTRTANGVNYWEILFAPSGAVIGQGTGAGKVMLYVQDNNQVQSPGQPTLLVIDVRSGFIGAFPVNTTTADPYLYTESGAPSGL
jgi:prepilin-type N-terminal cleavage/methylation domain-containing protein